MAAKTQSLKFKRTVKASVGEVYRMFTNATALREWLCNAATVDARKGGRIHLWWNDGYYMTGDFTAFTPGKKVAFTWVGWREPGEMRIDVSLAEKNGATQVTVTHSGLGSGKAWADTLKSFQQAWPRSLENLQSVMETGHDLRFTLRPMLGVNIGLLDAGIAKKIGVPVSDGVKLDGVAEGMGAHAAGLRKDDVLVSMAGKKIANWAGLTTVLQEHRAGDEVKVVYYRGADKLTAAMKLSARRIDEPPATAQALAETARKMHADFGAKLAGVFEGASEEEASHRPGLDEWSAKDVVCHLIGGERDNHVWIVDLVGGQERWSDDWPGNLSIRHAGIMAAFPTSASLLGEWTRHAAETAAMLAALPAEFVARKATFWRLGYNLLQATDHFGEHMAQMSAAIESARKK